MMLHDHLNVTKAEAIARLQGNYTSDIAAFDDIHMQAVQMADAISEGIIAQLPDRFKEYGAKLLSYSFLRIMPLLSHQVCHPSGDVPKECVFVDPLGFQIAFHMLYT
jgi:hypothetical protein